MNAWGRYMCRILRTHEASSFSNSISTSSDCLPHSQEWTWKKIRMTFALPLICMFLFIITKCSSSVIVTFFFLLPRRTEFEITLIMFIFVVVHVCANVISGTHTPAAVFVRFKRKYNVQLLSVRDMRMVMLVPSEWFMYVFICDTSSLCALFNALIFQVVHAFA